MAKVRLRNGSLPHGSAMACLAADWDEWSFNADTSIDALLESDYVIDIFLSCQNSISQQSKW